MNHAPDAENKRWIVTCQDAADGTGDLIVPLPADLLTEMGLADGDTLHIIEAYAGTHKSLVLSKTATIPDRTDELVEHFNSEDLEDIHIAEQRMSKIRAGRTKATTLEETVEKYHLDHDEPEKS